MPIPATPPVPTSYAISLLERMNFVRRKVTTAKSNLTIQNISEIKKYTLEEVKATVTMEEIPAELILNWDKTGSKIVPVSPWTTEMLGSERVDVVGVDDKHQTTTVFCGTLTGDYLPV